MNNHKSEIEELKKTIDFHKKSVKEAEDKIETLEGEVISSLNTGDKIKVRCKNDRNGDVIHRGIFSRVRFGWKNNFEWLDIDVEAYLDKVRYSSHANDLVQIGWDEPIEASEPEAPKEPECSIENYLTQKACHNCKHFEVVTTYQGLVHETLNHYCKKNNARVNSSYSCDEFELNPPKQPEPQLPEVEQTCGNCTHFRVWGASCGCDKTAHSTKPESWCGAWREFKAEGDIREH